jgi:acyl dehydratase
MTAAKRYFEDLVVEERFVQSRARTVSEREIIDFATLYDPQYFHADADAARESRFGSVIASGIQVMAIWRSLDHEIAQDIAWICGIAWEDVRWHLALRPGDTVRARARCLAKRISNSDPTRGVVTFEYQLVNHSDKLVWSCRSLNLVERRPGATA